MRLILIVGPIQSGKTWMANCILATEKLRGQHVDIFDEPELNLRGVARRIEAYAKNNIVILTCISQPIWPEEMRKPDLIISLHPNV